MISVGIDVSKEKYSMYLKPYGEIVSKPFNITHTQKFKRIIFHAFQTKMMKSKSLWKLNRNLSSSSSYIFTGKRIFVSVINPYLMKSYRNESLRKPKPTRLIPVSLLIYGIDHLVFKMKNFKFLGDL